MILGYTILNRMNQIYFNILSPTRMFDIADLSSSMLVTSFWEKTKITKSYTPPSSSSTIFQKSLLNNNVFSITNNNLYTATTTSCFNESISVSVWVLVNNLQDNFTIISSNNVITNNNNFSFSVNNNQVICNLSRSNSQLSNAFINNNISNKWSYLACSLNYYYNTVYISNSSGNASYSRPVSISPYLLGSGCATNTFDFSFFSGTFSSNPTIYVKNIQVFNSRKDIVSFDIMKNK